MRGGPRTTKPPNLQKNADGWKIDLTWLYGGKQVAREEKRYGTPRVAGLLLGATETISWGAHQFARSGAAIDFRPPHIDSHFC